MKRFQKLWRLGMLAFAGILAAVVLAPQHAVAHGELLFRINSATKRITEATNNFAQLYLDRGELYREDQNWAAAEADYTKAAQLDPNLVAVDFCRARMLDESGRLDESRSLFDKFLARFPNDGDAYFGRARVLVKLNNRSAAIADYRRGLELTRDVEPQFFLELAQTLMAEKKIPEALAVLDDGIKKFGPIPTLQTIALDLEVERKNYDTAIARLETLMQPAQRKESWLARRGDILLLAGRTEEAHKSYEGSLAAVKTLPPRLQQSPSVLALQVRMNAALSPTNAPAVLKADKASP